MPSVIALHGKLASDLNLPSEVRLGLEGSPTGQLAILHATNFPGAPGGKVGQYEVVFADGGRSVVDLVYGDNIHAVTDLSGSPDSPVVWVGKTRSGDRVALRALVWTMPEKDRPIRELVLRSEGAGPSPFVLAVTGMKD